MNGKSIFCFLVFVFCFQLLAKNDIKIISSNTDYLIVEYIPYITDSLIVTINGEKYWRIKLLNCSNDSYKPGLPDLPLKVINIGVPSETGNSYQVIQSDYVDIKGNIEPIPALKKENGINTYEYKIDEKYYLSKFKNEVVAFGEYGKMRELQIQNLIVSPLQFDYASHTLRIYKKIIIKITFSKSGYKNSIINDNLVSGTVINFAVAKNWGAEKNTSLKKEGIKNSALSTGKWYRFEAPEEGIYKITKQMLPSYGIDPATVDPRTIKIYNNGGKELPESILENRPVDLMENAIIITGEEDGKFDDNDYILFYGRGINFHEYDTNSMIIRNYFNHFSNNNYYWITSGSLKGKRIGNKTSLNQSNSFAQNSTRAFLFEKKESTSPASSGRNFVGDPFTDNKKEREYQNVLDGFIQGSKVDYNISMVNATPKNINLEITENSLLISSTTLSKINNVDYEGGATSYISASYAGVLNTNRSILKFRFVPLENMCSGYLDYFEICYNKDLKAVNDKTLFFANDTTAVIEYRLSGFSNSSINVFDVTDFSNVKIISNPVMISGGDYVFQSAEKNGNPSKYLAAGPAAYKTPVNSVSVANSNLRGFADGVKLIIITHSAFIDQANSLKKYREEEADEKISTAVFTVDKIFNEFSGGAVDPAGIRDFLKYAYDNWKIKPEYVLLFGDGDYDYKNILKTNRNFVIPYETDESLNYLGYSFCSDDFYGLISGADVFIDIAIGRVNVASTAEAAAFVNKLKYYEKKSDQSNWRNKLILVADDKMTSAGPETTEFTYASEILYNNFIPRSMDITKIYLGAYPTVYSPIRRKPAVNQAIIDAINSGALIFNYIGHGNTRVLAHEEVFEKNLTIPQLINSNYFFLSAATCDFGWYDNPMESSSTELLLLKPDGGCIGALAACRPVQEGANNSLNQMFFNALFNSKKDSLGLSVSIGAAYLLSKANNGDDGNRLRFHLFGDPSMRLLLPRNKAQFDSVNDVSTDVPEIQIKALQKVKIKGSVRKPDGTKWSSYNGEGNLSIYDSEIQRYLEEVSTSVIYPGGLIFNGKVSIIDGQFEASFVVPKDISYENKFGKMVFYFYNQAGDGIALFSNIRVGGSDTNLVNDKKGPEIEICFDSQDIHDAKLINSSSTLIVKLKDETGLNTTGTGVGHKLEGIFNGDENYPVDFTTYYSGDVDANGKAGKINYKLNNLSSGNYNLKVKAWDVFNNFNEGSADFTVVSGDKLELMDVYNYPNPFRQNTTFTFQQNFAVPVDVKIRVFTVSGRLIKEVEKKNISEKFIKIGWDGRDEDNNQLANGVYLYKLIVRTSDGAYDKSVFGKIAILR